MATGRCEGCGRTGSACKISEHVIQCPDWLALPYACQLDPQLSYAQYKAGGQQTERVARKQDLTSKEVTLRSAADARWATPKDILDD